ncbi:hypothetical protein ACOZ38_03485 [Sphaerisporangium viridialbum]|uniref:hypothetical protein n=1 Tax=Sphaerisporangium viridialbum TaxID=46189 RepID=UPI003C790990
MLGRHDEALKTLNTLRKTADKGVTGDRYGFWSPSQIHFAESWVYAATGYEAAADTARENVLKITRDYQYRVNVRLHGALCTVVQGGVDEGLRQAATAIDALTPAFRSGHIIETGRMVLRAVPRDQQDRPSAAELGKVLALEPAKSA